MSIKLKPKRYTLNPNLGFVLLFSLLISAILLATGLGISRIMVRQITLASLSRESQVAFFAADSGLECAVHWDTFGRFQLPTVDTLGNPVTVARNIYCNGAVIADGGATVMSGGGSSSCDPLGAPPSANKMSGETRSCFTFRLPEANACAFVVIDKSDPTGLQTKITSNGYNGCNLTASNILQRTLEIKIVNQ